MEKSSKMLSAFGFTFFVSYTKQYKESRKIKKINIFFLKVIIFCLFFYLSAVGIFFAFSHRLSDK